MTVQNEKDTSARIFSNKFGISSLIGLRPKFLTLNKRNLFLLSSLNRNFRDFDLRSNLLPLGFSQINLENHSLIRNFAVVMLRFLKRGALNYNKDEKVIVIRIAVP